MMLSHLVDCDREFDRPKCTAHLLWGILCAFWVLLHPVPCFAVDVAFIPPSDVTDLLARRPFSVGIAVSGLEAGEQLETLAVSVEFDASLLRAIRVTQGDIIPNPLDDPLDFYTSIGVRGVDTTFLTLGFEQADRINANGLFFTLRLMPLLPDSQGSLTFTLGDAQQFNPMEPEEPLFPEVGLGQSLTFAVTDQEPPIAGDYDLDDDVDGRDFLAWQRDLDVGILADWQANYGGDGAPTSIGDFDADGDTDGRDFLAWQRNPGVGNLANWQANYGAGLPATVTTVVPEPAVLILLLAGPVIIVCTDRSRRSCARN